MAYVPQLSCSKCLTVSAFAVLIFTVSASPIRYRRGSVSSEDEDDSRVDRRCVTRCLKQFLQHSLEELFCMNMDKLLKCGETCFTTVQAISDNVGLAWTDICLSAAGSAVRRAKVQSLYNGLEELD